MEPITRTSYRDPSLGNVERDGITTLRENNVDIERYTRPLERAHGSALHVAGVATGLEVRATIGQPAVRVAPGVALSPTGQHVVLAAGGRAVLESGPVDVADDGVPVPTAAADGTRLLTIAWGETFDRATWSSSGHGTFQNDHTPVLTLHAPGDPAGPGDTVLATVTVAAGAVTDLTGAGRVATDRVALTATTRTTAGGALTVGAAGAGLLHGVDGGVELSAGSAGALSVTGLGVGATPALVLNGRVAADERDGHLDLNAAGGFPAGVRVPATLTAGQVAAGRLTVGGAGDPGPGGLAVGGPLLVGKAPDGAGWLRYAAAAVSSTLSIGVDRPGDRIVFVRAGQEQLTVHDGEVLVPGTLSAGVLAASTGELTSLTVSGRFTATSAGVTQLSVTGGMSVGGRATCAVLDVPGDVHLAGSSGQVFIGGNQNGLFLELHDDLWFSDPQTGAIEIRNGTGIDWGTMVGHFLPPSSARFKEDIRAVEPAGLEALYDDALATPVCTFRYRGADPGARPAIGVVLEDSPPYLARGDGLSTSEYVAMLHATVQVMATRMAALSERLDATVAAMASDTRNRVRRAQ